MAKAPIPLVRSGLTSPHVGYAAPVAPWGTLHNLAPTEGAAARNTTEIASEVVTLIATGNCYWKAGDSNVDAANTDYYLPANSFIDIATGVHTHLSVLSAAGEGTIAAQIIERS